MDELQREFLEMQLHGLKTLWGSYLRTMDAVMGEGYGKDIQPHKRAALKSAANKAIDRWLHCVEVMFSYQQMLGLFAITGPEQPRRIPIMLIEDKSTKIEVKKVKKNKDDDKKEAA